MRSLAAGLLVAQAVLLATPSAADGQGDTHALIVVGLGGSAEYREEFHRQGAQLHAALTEQHRVPLESVTYLGEKVEVDPEVITDRSTRANVLEVLADLARRAGARDRIVVVLIGHGTASTSRGAASVSFNLPGPDLTPEDFASGLVAFPTQSLALVHTGSGSGGFLAPLSGPNRVIITATRSERELNATEFGQFFAAAVGDEGSDLDKNGRVSLLEAFTYARQEVARFYQAENELLTEHALLDDNGDGEGTHEAGLDVADGSLAATFHLDRDPAAAARADSADPALLRLYEELDEIQGRVEGLRAVQDALTEDEYLAQMEELLVELAFKNREIRALEGGGA